MSCQCAEYQFRGNPACGPCSAVHTFSCKPPARPHENCRCEIVLENCSNYAEVDFSDVEISGDSIIASASVYICCWDGTEYWQGITIFLGSIDDWGGDPEGFMDRAFESIQEEALLSESVCPSCNVA